MIHFVVHDEGDGVGVVVVEGIKAGQELTGWIMEDDKDHQGEGDERHPDRPQGRATKDFKKGDTVIKYGVDIGKAVAADQAWASTRTCTTSRPSAGKRKDMQ